MLLFVTAALAATPSSKIINGEAATIDQYPATGGMMMDAELSYPGYQPFPFRSLICSSTLIAPDVVLLAAHCIDELAMTQGYGDLEVNEIRWTRQADLTEWQMDGRIRDWPADSVAAWDWVAHPNWDMMGLGMGLAENYDIALLFLDTPVLDVEHAYLPSFEEGAQLTEGMPLVVVGWGQQTATGWGEQPPPGTYGIKQWGNSYIAELGLFEFQVGLNEEDVRKCHGDSGGPSFAEVEADTVTTTRLVGVTSHAYDQSDCKRTGGVDTRVDAYLDWIDSELRARCADGTRAWCEQEGIVYAPVPEVEEPEELTFREKVGERFAGFGCSSTGSGAPLGAVGGLLLGAVALTRRRR